MGIVWFHITEKGIVMGHSNKRTLKQAGFTHVKYLGDGQHLLRDEDGNYEVWFSNKNHASFGLIHKNTHLEFGHSVAITFDNPVQ